MNSIRTLSKQRKLTFASTKATENSVCFADVIARISLVQGENDLLHVKLAKANFKFIKVLLFMQFSTILSERIRQKVTCSHQSFTSVPTLICLHIEGFIFEK